MKHPNNVLKNKSLASRFHGDVSPRRVAAIGSDGKVYYVMANMSP